MQDNLRNQTDALIRGLSDPDGLHDQIATVVEKLQAVFRGGGKVLAAGNGGSATLCQHLSDEMVGRYRISRAPLPVIALSADTAVLTCIGNDFGFEKIFSRQVEAIGRRGDALILFSSSGKSPNIYAAAEQAGRAGVTTIGFCGKDGPLEQLVDFAIVANSTDPARIQEMHLHAIHLICEAFEQKPGTD